MPSKRAAISQKKESVWTDNYIVEASLPMIILFSVFCKDVGSLYKSLTFQPKGLHQSQILHVYNNKVNCKYKYPTYWMTVILLETFVF